MEEPTIAATDFKALCLRWLDRVAEEGRGLTITKRGRPVARLVPIESPDKPLAGRWEGQVKVEGDVVYFDTSSEWEALETTICGAGAASQSYSGVLFFQRSLHRLSISIDKPYFLEIEFSETVLDFGAVSDDDPNNAIGDDDLFRCRRDVA